VLNTWVKITGRALFEKLFCGLALAYFEYQPSKPMGVNP